MWNAFLELCHACHHCSVTIVIFAVIAVTVGKEPKYWGLSLEEGPYDFYNHGFTDRIENWAIKIIIII